MTLQVSGPFITGRTVHVGSPFDGVPVFHKAQLYFRFQMP